MLTTSTGAWTAVFSLAVSYDTTERPRHRSASSRPTSGGAWEAYISLLLVVADGIGKLDDAPDHFRREQARELGREDAGERVEVNVFINFLWVAPLVSQCTNQQRSPGILWVPTVLRRQVRRSPQTVSLLSGLALR